MGLLIVSFLYANVAISYTFLQNVGVRRTIAYRTSIFLSIIVVVPFVAVRILDGLFPGTLFIDLGVKVVIHFLAAILVGTSAYVFYQRIKIRPSPGQIWIILLLLYWTVAELVLMSSHLIPGYGLVSETKIPYLWGAILSAILIPMSVRSTLHPNQTKERRLPPILALMVLLSALLLAVSEILRTYYISMTELALSSTINAGIMLSLSYLSMFAILMYVLLITSASGGNLSFDTLGASLAAVWVVITIIKTNYEVWTIGWWSAEIILLFSIIMFLIILIRFYFNDANRAMNRERTAVAFSSYLSSLISSHQRSAIDSLSDISMDATISDSTLTTISKAMSDISHANELSKHLDIFVSGKEFQKDQIEPISIRDSISSGLENAGLATSKDLVEVQEGGQSIELRMEKDCLVLGNSFLVDAFQNVLLGISRRIGHYDKVSIKIRDSYTDNSQCIVEMSLNVQVEDSDNVLGLFGRYIGEESLNAVEIAYSKRIITLLGGAMKLKASKIDDNMISIAIVIELQKA
jgi:hypothetical protein